MLERMEAVTLRAVLRQVREECVPARVGAVFQSSADDLVVSLGGRGGRNLVISAAAAAPTVHLAPSRPPAFPSPAPFCLLLRRHLAGLVLTGAVSTGLEKVARLHFGPTASPPPSLTLVAELTGRRGNVVLLEGGTARVVDALRPVPGGEYRPPPAGGRVDPAALDREGFLRLCDESRATGRPLHALLIGLGPGLQALAEERSDAAGDAALFDALRGIVERVDGGTLAPVYYPRRRLVLPFPVEGWGDEPREDCASVGEALHRARAEALEEEERRRLSARVRRDISRRLKKVRRKRDLLRDELGEGKAGDLLQTAGSALLAALDEVPRGASSFTFTSPGGNGGAPLSVDLDPSLGPRQNAQLLFKKAKKARRRAESARERLPAVEAAMKALEEGLEGIDGLPLDELRRRGAAPAGKGRRAPAAAPPALSQIREYRSSEWRILVGKSSRGNDYLTAKVARPGDLWFHARDCPGAHVVLKPRGRDDPPGDDAIRAAGEAAAWHSAARGETLVDVAYTPRKHVRKVKGQPPGKVLVPQSKTVRVRPGIPAGFREVKPGE